MKIMWRHSVARSVIVGFLVIVPSLVMGWQEVTSSVVWSPMGVYLELMNGPVRLLFPVIVTMISVPTLSQELRFRYVTYIRSRNGMRLHLAKRLFVGAVSSFAVFAIFAGLAFGVAYGVTPLLAPSAIDPASYGLHNPAQVIAADTNIAPLNALRSSSFLLFAAASIAWPAMYAFMFSLFAMCAVIMVEASVLALLVPLAAYLGESVLTQIIGLPAASFLVSALYPAGLNSYSLEESAVAAMVLGVCVVCWSSLLVNRAPSLSRFS